ncbi:hypothetical protein AGMMS49574_24410 [Bacteroidia bacterium]|nr:hypothetical protein AGMMS49574_24410 [Bacteroidia bacterium]
MKKLKIFILFVIVPFLSIAQQQTEYNMKGDEAMKQLDYSDARLFYGEGVPHCDMYSISKLTTIWIANEEIRASMHILMSRCLNCLNVKATENDSTAISQLIVYYSEGIGTAPTENLAMYWAERLEGLRKPVETVETYTGPKPIKQPIRFFAGYSFSLQSPLGITVGGMGSKFGLYGRFKTNAIFQSSQGEFSGAKPDVSDVMKNIDTKHSSYGITGGLVVRLSDWLSGSVGAGYCKYDQLYKYSVLDDNGNEQGTRYYKNASNSFQGVTAEVDGIIEIGGLYVTAGFNVLNFKYIDLNAGFGMFF